MPQSEKNGPLFPVYFKDLMLALLLFLAFILPGLFFQQNKAEKVSIQQTPQSSSSGSDNTDVIVIDAGHGGDDPGMVGANQTAERDLNLIYAQKLKKHMEQNGYQVIMTRTGSEWLCPESASNKKAVDMQKRIAIIEQARPALTISIHQNSYPDSSVKGPQVFYYEHSANGHRLAACIQSALNTALSIKRPRTEKGNTSYYMLRRSQSVTVIVECGFLSNPEEEALLQDDSYQDRIVQAVFDGIQSYLTENAV